MLRDPKLGLTRKEINLLLSSVDVDGDGQVSFAEFVPLCFDILVEQIADHIVSSEALQVRMEAITLNPKP